MGTKNNPGSFDCYANAEPDEPFFTLLARDNDAAGLVRTWANIRLSHIANGTKPESDLAMVREARDCADAMDAWRHARELAKHEAARAKEEDQ